VADYLHAKANASDPYQVAILAVSRADVVQLNALVRTALLAQASSERRESTSQWTSNARTTLSRCGPGTWSSSDATTTDSVSATGPGPWSLPPTLKPRH
jgi:hypothetical protein